MPRQVDGGHADLCQGREKDTRVAPAILSVRVVPGASKSEIVGLEGGALKVRLAAPPVRGKANRELAKLLARALGVRSHEVEIVSGHSARLKTVKVHGVDPGVASRLADITREPTG